MRILLDGVKYVETASFVDSAVMTSTDNSVSDKEDNMVCSLLHGEIVLADLSDLMSSYVDGIEVGEIRHERWGGSGRVSGCDELKSGFDAVT